MRTANPALNSETFSAYEVSASSRTMTLEGTATKTAFLLALLTLAASWTWQQVAGVNPQAVMPWVMGGAIGGLVLAFVTIFKKEWAPVTSPLYAIAEGLLLGALSALTELRFPGIVFQAVTLTFGTLFSLLIAYR